MKSIIKISFIICLAFAGVYLSCAPPFASCRMDKLSKDLFNGSFCEIEQLLEGGANVDARDRNGDTALIK